VVVHTASLRKTNLDQKRDILPQSVSERLCSCKKFKAKLRMLLPVPRNLHMCGSITLHLLSINCLVNLDQRNSYGPCRHTHSLNDHVALQVRDLNREQCCICESDMLSDGWRSFLCLHDYQHSLTDKFWTRQENLINVCMQNAGFPKLVASFV